MSVENEIKSLADDAFISNDDDHDDAESLTLRALDISFRKIKGFELYLGFSKKKGKRTFSFEIQDTTALAAVTVAAINTVYPGRSVPLH